MDDPITPPPGAAAPQAPADLPALLAAAVERSASAVAVLEGPELSCTAANAAARRLAASPWVGLRLAGILPQIARDGRVPALESALAEGRSVRLFRIDGAPRPDGSPSYWDIEAVPVGDPRPSVVLIAHDVTGEVLVATAAEERAMAAEEDQARLRALMRHAPTGIAIIDRETRRVLEISDHAVAMLGGPTRPRTAGGKGRSGEGWCLLNADGTEPDPALTPVGRALDGAVAAGEEWWMRCRDGGLLRVRCNAAPIRDDRGAVTGCVVVWRDMSGDRG